MSAVNLTGRMAHGRRRATRPRRARRSAGRFWRGFAKGFGQATGLTGPRIGYAVGIGLMRLAGRPVPKGVKAWPARPAGKKRGRVHTRTVRVCGRDGVWVDVTRTVRGRGSVNLGLPKAKPGTPPPFSGPHVKATSTMPKAPLFGTRVESTGLAGPGNRGAGPGMGAPAYGTGGAHGDDGHLISPGSAGGSATGGAPNTSGAPIGGDQRRPLDDRAVGGAKINHGKTSGGPMEGTGSTPSTPTTPTTGGGGDLARLLGEAPETDADYVNGMRAISDQLRALGDAVTEYQATIIEQVGVDQSATSQFEPAAESISSAANHISAAVADFLNTYGSVIDLAASGKTIPDGKGGSNRFWTGDVR